MNTAPVLVSMRSRTYRTPQGCEVRTCQTVNERGAVIEHVTLECPLETVADGKVWERQ